MSISPLSAVGITRYHRAEREFELIRRSFLRNPELRLAAFRVGAYVLSHADGFVQTQAQIARGCRLSVSTVRKALLELEDRRYVARRLVREKGQWIGTAYAVSDQPFTDEELAQLCPPCTESEHSQSERTGFGARKKTTPVRETMTTKKTNPSGGSLRESDRPSTEENKPMPPTRSEMLTFDLELPEPERPDKPAKEPNAGDVVAAFVDSFRRHHSGGDPIRRDLGRVARDAKQLITAGRATVAELVDAAAALGSGPYSNLGVQLNMLRDNRPRTRGIVPPAPRGSFAEAHETAERAFVEEIRTDPKVAAWVAEDPEAVSRYVAMDPTLKDVFARLVAA